MAVKTDYTPTVKAYEYGNTIIVKYYDNGEASSLSCPLCHWIGSMDAGAQSSATELVGEGCSEFRCPDCNTKLARVSPSKQ